MAADTTKPVLTSLVLPRTVDLSKGNVSVKATVGATDTGSGVEYVFIGFDRNYQTSSGRADYFSFYDRSDSFADGKSSFGSIITSDTYSGIYKISYISVKDKAGNYAFYNNDDLVRLGFQTSITVTGTKTDTTKPALTSLVLPKVIDLSRGDALVTATVGATDTGSGIDYVFVNFDRAFQTDHGLTDYFSLYDRNDSFSDGKSSSTQVISKSTAAGTYDIKYVALRDKAGNFSFYEKDDLIRLGLQTSVTVKGAVADKTKPVLTSLLLPKTIDLSKGDVSVTATVGAKDTGSGIDYVLVNLDRSYQSKTGPTRSFTLYDKFDSFSDGKSSVSDFVLKSTALGTYGISSVTVADKAGNLSVYSKGELASLGFQTSIIVKGVEKDTTKPVLTALTLPRTIDLSKGGVPVTATVGAKDAGSGVDYVLINLDKYFQSEVNGSVNSFTFYDKHDSFADGKSSMSDLIAKSTNPGTYSINSVTIADKAGNLNVYSKGELARLGFQTSVTVTKDKPDTTKPVLTSLTLPEVIDLTKGSVSIKVTAGAKDTGSGVDAVFLEFEHGGESLRFRLDDSHDSFLDGKSSTNQVITKDTEPGTYNATSFAVRDYAGNITVYSQNDLKKMGFQTSIKVKDPTQIRGSFDDDTLHGTSLDDRIDGYYGDDKMYGLTGNDTYFVDSIEDKIFETKGQGNDTIVTTVSYALAAGQEVETLKFDAFFQNEDLNLSGNEYGQTLIGNFRKNVLDGRGGADTLKGDEGQDTFVFSTKLGAGNIDHIVDFSAVDDGIKLAKSIFTALSPGKLAASAFKDLGTPGAKVDADDRILYKQATGELFYDADGSGKAAAVKFAVLDNHAALTHVDFLVA